MSPTQHASPGDDRLAEVLSIHFDRKWGTPYWIQRAERLAFDPRDEIRSATDLPKLGLMDPADLRQHGIEHHIPKRLLHERSGLIFAQTGGTLGPPVWTAYLEAEFDEAFVEPFVVAAKHVGFPEAEQWLYIGPSGPHVIGRAASAIARRTGSHTPFMVDFDARWAKKLPVKSFAAGRYLTHIIDQAMAILARQHIGVLFTTPPVLHRLAEQMTREQRERIHGVHYGGMALGVEELARFQEEVFPNAVHLAGYGNTLFGCCLELTVTHGRNPRYFPHGERLVFGVLTAAGEEPPQPEYERSGSKGRIVFTRIDRAALLVNVVERDEGTVVRPPDDAPRDFTRCGIASPQPQRMIRVPSGAAIY